MLCVASITDENRIEWFVETRHPEDLDRIGGALRIVDEIQKIMTYELKCESEHFKERIIFMSMYKDSGWRQR